MGKQPVADRRWGLPALFCYLAHALFWIVSGAPANILWACHLGALLVAAGWLWRRDVLNAVGTLWLGLGNALWIGDLLRGAVLYPTSALTHLGGLAIGLYGVALMGMPRRSWLRAALGLAPLWLFTRLVSTAADNVNMAFRVYSGWEGTFHCYPLFMLLLFAAATLAFLALETTLLACRRRTSRP